MYYEEMKETMENCLANMSKERRDLIETLRKTSEQTKEASHSDEVPHQAG